MNPLKHIIPDSEEITHSEIKYGDVLAFRNGEAMAYRFVTVTNTNHYGLGNPDRLYLRVKTRKLPTEFGSVIEAHRIQMSNLTEPILMFRRPPSTNFPGGSFQTLNFGRIPGLDSPFIRPELILDWREVDIIPRDL